MRPSALVARLLCVCVPAFALAPVARAAVVNVNVQNFSFSPKDIVVQQGDTVQWTWISGAHTAANGADPSSPGAGTLFNSPLDSGHPSAQWVVPGDFTPGIVDFHCGPHWFAGMTGTITVTPGAPVAARHDVLVRDFEFDPANLAVDPGDTVCWVWESGVHTTTSGSGSNPIFNPGSLWDAVVDAGNPVFCRVFADEGTYPYFCTFHEAQDMRGVVVAGGSITGVPDGGRTGIVDFLPPFPNPSAHVHNMRLTLEATAEVDLVIHDLSGRRIATVFHGSLPPGAHNLRWDGTLRTGGTAGSGIYFARVSAGGDVEVHKIFRAAGSHGGHGH